MTRCHHGATSAAAQVISVIVGSTREGRFSEKRLWWTSVLTHARAPERSPQL
jgi:hypothetical protein